MAEAEEYTADEEFAEDEETEAEDLALDDEIEELDTFEALEEDPVEVAVIPDEEEEEEAEVEELEEEAEVVEDEEEESLDVLLSRDKAAAEEEDLGRLEEPRDGLTVTAQPISASEFTCRSCFLVKNRAQLADEEHLICFDCA